MLVLSIKFSQARLTVTSSPEDLKISFPEANLRAWLESDSSTHAYLEQILSRDDIHFLLQDLKPYDVDLSRDFLEFVFAPIPLVERSNSTDLTRINANTHFSDESNSTEHMMFDVETLLKDEIVTLEDVKYVSQARFVDRSEVTSNYKLITESVLKDKSKTEDQVRYFLYNTYAPTYFAEYYTVEEV